MSYDELRAYQEQVHAIQWFFWYLTLFLAIFYTREQILVWPYVTWINVPVRSHMSRAWPIVALLEGSGNCRSWGLMESFKVKGLWDLRSSIIFCCFLYIEVKSLFYHLPPVLSTIGRKQCIFLVLDWSLQNRETRHEHKPLSMFMNLFLGWLIKVASITLTMGSTTLLAGIPDGTRRRKWSERQHSSRFASWLQGQRGQLPLAPAAVPSVTMVHSF